MSNGNDMIESSTGDENKQPVEEQKIKTMPVETRQFILEEEFSSPATDKELIANEVVPLPSVYVDNIGTILEGTNPDQTDKKTVEWAETVTASAQTAGVDGTFIQSLKNEDADFKQHLQTGSEKLSIETPKFKKVENQILDGEKAVILARNLFGLGSMVRVPLFHSGFWITLKAPSEAELLELNRQLTTDKIELGRSSYGLAFSNQTVFYVSRIYELVKSCIHSHSVKTDKDISNFIYAHDIPIIIWGLACAVWPNGFNYSRACMANPNECNHVVTEKLNLSKLLWTNNSVLNTWQKNHMHNKLSGSMSEEDVLRYRKELINNQSKKITIDTLSEPFAVKLKTPTAAEWITQGTSWINNIVESVTTAISSTASVSERNNYMINVAKAQTIRQYSHWIDSIEIGTNRIEDRETIENTISALSSSDDLRSEVIKNVQSYIDETVISMIGIPVYNCPKCNEPVDKGSNSQKFVNIIPLEVNTIFFILLMQRIARIAMR